MTPVTVARRAAVTTVWLERPEVRNAIDQTTADTLRTCFARLAKDEECQVVVLRGRGGYFCAGWDVADFSEFKDSSIEQLEQRLNRNHELLTHVHELPQVTVAAVEGVAIGFGLGFLTACDIAWAAEGTKFALPELRFGLVPGSVLTELQRSVPTKAALDWMLSGRTFGSEEALAGGLLSRVLPADQFDQELDRLTEQLGSVSRRNLLRTKVAFRTAATLPDDEATKFAIREAAVSARNPAVGAAADDFQKRRHSSR